MSDVTVMTALLAAIAGLSLSFAARRTAAIASAVFAAAAAMSSSAVLPASDTAAATIWLSAAFGGGVAAIFRPTSPGVLLPLAAGFGFAAALRVPAADAWGLFAFLLILPASALNRRGGSVATRTLVSWAVAATILAAVLPLVSLPGSAPAHME